jgi:hypothetical protein
MSIGVEDCVGLVEEQVEVVGSAFFLSSEVGPQGVCLVEDGRGSYGRRADASLFSNHRSWPHAGASFDPSACFGRGRRGRHHGLRRTDKGARQPAPRTMPGLRLLLGDDADLQRVGANDGLAIGSGFGLDSAGSSPAARAFQAHRSPWRRRSSGFPGVEPGAIGGPCTCASPNPSASTPVWTS